MSKNITLGSDPEIFIENAEGKVMSAIGLIPGTKKEPHPITDEGHFIQTDNIAFEFNIPPCKTEDEFVKNILFVKDYLANIAESKGFRLSTKSSESVSPDQLTDTQALVFGCDPDFNPYLQTINDAPQSKDKNLRSVGGHVHIGYPEPSVEKSEKIIKAFDMFVALPALLIDKDERRRELYGKAGAFRFKEPWGVEARVLSNFWIHSEENIRWVYQNTIKAVEIVLSGDWDKYYSKHEELVMTIINTNDKDKAVEFIKNIKELSTI